MLAVIDTNVLVSALINRQGRPGQIVAKIRAFELTPVVSEAMLAEYRDVLRRARFGFSSDRVAALLDDMQALALCVRPEAIVTASLPDPDDAIFIVAALAAACPVVTGNARHFPVEAGVEVLSPAACVERLLRV